MTRTAVTLASAVVLAGAALVPPVAHAATAPAPAPAATARVAANAATTSYVVAAHTGRTARLLLVDRATGTVRRTLTTAPELGDARFPQTPFSQATVAPDGTVWAVRSGNALYDTRLLRIAGGRVQTFAPYVLDVSVSPDGTRVAYSVMSPDADHDGYGTMSLRVGATSGRGAQTVLASHRFRVDRAGRPVGLVARYQLLGWTDRTHVAVSVGSQDQFALSVVATDRVVPQARWAKRYTPYPPFVIGYDRAGRLLRATPQLRGDTATALTVDALSATAPTGTRVATVPCSDGTTAQLAAWARRTGVRVTDVGVAVPPLRGVSGIDAVYLPR